MRYVVCAMYIGNTHNYAGGLRYLTFHVIININRYDKRAFRFDYSMTCFYEKTKFDD